MKDNSNQELGTRLKTLRKKSDMNQMQVAEILDMKRETYASWEIGRSAPKYDMLVKISKLYNISCEYLLTGTDSNFFGVNTNNDYNKDIYADNYVNELSAFEKTILMKIRLLNLNDKQKVATFIEDLKDEKK